MILFLLSVLAGMLTVLAPCTIALLPVIVGGTVGGTQSVRRALIVTVALGLSVIIFTLLLKVSTSLIAVPELFWQSVSGGIIFALGLTMVFPGLWERLKFVGSLQRQSNRIIATGYTKQSIWGDLLVGAALGPVFSSCSPTYFLIIATVLPRSLAAGIVYLLAYTVGLCVTLFLVTLASQRVMLRLGVAADPRGLLKRSIGVLFLFLGIAIMTGYEKTLELVAANHIFDVTTIEQRLLPQLSPNTNSTAAPAPVDTSPTSTDVMTPSVGADLMTAPETSATGTVVNAPKPAATTEAASDSIRRRAKAARYVHAPEIANPSGYVNTGGKPIAIGDYVGKKVVLIDFWTYSCINCQRTLPYVKTWYDKYHDQGLEIISIHTPEFAFEKVQKNVESAAAGFGIQYPIVLDNQYGTWNAFGNQFWPRKYLIDIDGYIVYDHAGEGAYDVTEAAIQKALAERASILHTAAVAASPTEVKDAITSDATQVGSPETYFGSARNVYLGNGTSSKPGSADFTLPAIPLKNTLYLGGTWNLSPEFAESTSAHAKVVYVYNTRDVYFVASAKTSAVVKVSVDGKPVGTYAGSDVAADGTVTITGNRLYKIIHGADYGQHTLELEVIQGSIDAYTFTFG